MDNVERLNFETKADIPVDSILEAAIEAHKERPFKRLAVVAVYADDDEEYFASSDAEAGVVLWDLERFKHMLVTKLDEEHD